MLTFLEVLLFLLMGPPVSSTEAIETLDVDVEIVDEDLAVLGAEYVDAADIYAQRYGCDPVETIQPGVPKPKYTKATKHATLKRIYAECRSWGATEEACTVLKLMASRESSGKPGPRHRLPGDSAMALSTYISQGPRYGWYVTWPWEERMICEGKGDERVCEPNWAAVVLDPVPGAVRRNPHYADPRRWATGLGAIGTNPALHLAKKVDPMAPPEILCVPEVSARVGLFTYQRAVDAFKAKTWVEVAAVFGGRVANNRPKRNAKMDRLFCERAERWGIDCHADPRGQLGRRIPQATSVYELEPDHGGTLDVYGREPER